MRIITSISIDFSIGRIDMEKICFHRSSFNHTTGIAGVDFHVFQHHALAACRVLQSECRCGVSFTAKQESIGHFVGCNHL